MTICQVSLVKSLLLAKGDFDITPISEPPPNGMIHDSSR